MIKAHSPARCPRRAISPAAHTGVRRRITCGHWERRLFQAYVAAVKSGDVFLGGFYILMGEMCMALYRAQARRVLARVQGRAHAWVAVAVA